MDTQILLSDAIDGQNSWSDISEMINSFEAEAKRVLVKAEIYDIDAWLDTVGKGFTLWTTDELQNAYFAGRVLQLVRDARTALALDDCPKAALVTANLVRLVMTLRISWLQLVVDKGLQHLNSDPRKAADAKAEKSRAETRVIRQGIYALMKEIGHDASAKQLEKELHKYTYRNPLHVNVGTLWVTGGNIKYKKDRGKVLMVGSKHFGNMISEQRKKWPDLA